MEPEQISIMQKAKDCPDNLNKWEQDVFVPAMLAKAPGYVTSPRETNRIRQIGRDIEKNSKPLLQEHREKIEYCNEVIARVKFKDQQFINQMAGMLDKPYDVKLTGKQRGYLNGVYQYLVGGN